MVQVKRKKKTIKMKDIEIKGNWKLFLDGVDYREITKAFLIAKLGVLVNAMDYELVYKAPREYPESKNLKIYTWFEIRQLAEDLYKDEDMTKKQFDRAVKIIEFHEKKKRKALLKAGKDVEVLTSTGETLLLAAPKKQEPNTKKRSSAYGEYKSPERMFNGVTYSQAKSAVSTAYRTNSVSANATFSRLIEKAKYVSQSNPEREGMSGTDFLIDKLGADEVFNEFYKAI